MRVRVDLGVPTTDRGAGPLADSTVGASAIERATSLVAAHIVLPVLTENGVQTTHEQHSWSDGYAGDHADGGQVVSSAEAE